MSDQEHPDDPERQDNQDQPYHQQVQHQSLSARLPESLGGGVFCTSSLIVESADMFLIDFVNSSAPPARLVARVVVTPTTMQQFLAALVQSCEKARSGRKPDSAGGDPGAAPTESSESTHATAGTGQGGAGGQAGTGGQTGSGGVPGGGNASQRSVEDIYSELKFTDDHLRGAFANTVIIRHSTDEVVLDFISNYFPRAVVTCRVTMATSRIERFRRSIEDAFRKYQEKKRGF